MNQFEKFKTGLKKIKPKKKSNHNIYNGPSSFNVIILFCRLLWTNWGWDNNRYTFC